jgi:uncharacterized protein (TIGR02147 family)
MDPVVNPAPDLFAFSDYRKYLKAHYEHRRSIQSAFSYRFMAQRLDIDAGQLAHILQGRLHLPQRTLPAVLKLCKFGSLESAYFEELLRLARSRTEAERERCAERLAALRAVVPRELGKDEAGFYAHWRHAVVRSLTGVVQARKAEGLGPLCDPPSTSAESEASVRLLEGLGLLARDGDGFLRPSQPHISAGAEVPREELRRWHDQVLDLAVRSVDSFGPADREVATLTAALSEEDFATVREWIADFRRQVQALAGGVASPDRVMEVCVQFFPVARVPEAASAPRRRSVA